MLLAMSVGCENKQLLANMFAITTSGVNMSALCVGEDFLSYHFLDSLIAMGCIP